MCTHCYIAVKVNILNPVYYEKKTSSKVKYNQSHAMPEDSIPLTSFPLSLLQNLSDSSVIPHTHTELIHTHTHTHPEIFSLLYFWTFDHQLNLTKHNLSVAYCQCQTKGDKKIKTSLSAFYDCFFNLNKHKHSVFISDYKTE